MAFVIAALSIRPGTKAELLEAARPAIEATRQEEGCIAYDLFESVTDPGRLVFVEEWDSADRLEAHSKSAHMKAFGRIAAKCFEAPPVVHIL